MTPALRSVCRTDWKVIYGLLEYFEKNQFVSPESALEKMDKSSREMIADLRIIKNVHEKIFTENELFFYIRKG